MPTDVIGIGKAAEAVTQEIRELLSLFFKPAVAEAGVWLGDRVHIARLRNLEKVLMKAKDKLAATNIEIKPVPTKIFLPLAEACSLEEEEEMINRWANLLAAAASDASVLPSYVQVLSGLSPAEAHVLDWVQKNQRDIAIPNNNNFVVLAVGIKDLRRAVGLSQNEFSRLIVNLQRLNLLSRRFEQNTLLAVGQPLAKLDDHFIGTTEFSDDFLAACNRIPQQQAPL